MSDQTEYRSVIAPYIDALLKDKRANGYDYHTEELVLNRFDAYCVEHKLETPQITREFLSSWMERSETEGSHQQAKRISGVRQLLLFMAACGVEVYLPHDFCRFEKPVPHIFDERETQAFFDVLDSYHPRHRVEQRLAGEYRLLFRMYCCCGLRNSEAAGIAAECVNLETGVLTILNSKGQKDRLVYLPEDLRVSCCEYYDWLCGELGQQPHWFFPASDPEKPLRNVNVDSVFRRLWSKTPYANCNNLPTVHDFRFTFVVNRMNRWSEEGVDLQVAMPYLSRYLGHKTVNDTFYYYYLVRDAFKTVHKKDTIAPDVIPEVRDYED